MSANWLMTFCIEERNFGEALDFEKRIAISYIVVVTMGPRLHAIEEAVEIRH